MKYAEISSGQFSDEIESSDGENQWLLNNEYKKHPLPKANSLSVIITALSNVSVQYNFTSISVALLMMSSTVCTTDSTDCNAGIQKEWVKTSATATIFIGAILGQLFMGFAGDKLGRDLAMVITVSLTSFGALLSSLFSIGSPSEIYILIIGFRFVLGIGAGGIYPLSATLAAEDGNSVVGNDVNIVSAAKAFFWQIPGCMLPWAFAYCLTFSNVSDVIKWKLILGLGCIPGFIVLLCYLAQGIQRQDARTTEGSTLDITNIYELLTDRKLSNQLLITGGGWFLYDVCYYGVSLFSGEILEALYHEYNDNVSSTRAIKNVSSHNLIALSTSIPATLLAIYLLHYISTKSLQFFGFLFVSFCFFVLALGFENLKTTSPSSLYFLYCMLIFSLSSGPNVTTYVLSAETYDIQYRSTFTGISSAIGKSGAIFGTLIFSILLDNSSYVYVMLICGILALLGAALTKIAIFLNNDE